MNPLDVKYGSMKVIILCGGTGTRLKEERKPRKRDRPREETKKFNKITPTPLFLIERLHTGFSTPVDNPITI